jgi:hypothetical protein
MKNQGKTIMTRKSPSRFRAHLIHMSLRTLAPAVLTVVMAGAAVAQDAEPPALVGRVAAISGQVSMKRSSDQDWTLTGVNEPLTVGDALYAQDGSDVRLQIGATDIDLKADSEIDMAALDQDNGRLRLDSGVMDLRVSAIPTVDGLFVLTPRGTVQLTQPGIYRIDAGTEDAPTQVTAWTGAAQLGDSSAAVTVQPGQTLVINGTPDQAQYSYLSNIGAPPDEWRVRARIVTDEHRYLPPDMTGGEDMYQYGSFQTAPEYGTVWYPNNVPADWQPYRYGHWENVAPWGQTWVDDQPWGFAPFHYGRWARIGDRWGWYPGEYTPHPVYAPALVAFVGGGGGFSASISFGGGEAVGWVPLAPGEGYRPPYRASPTYIENINRTTVINNITVVNGQRGPGGPRGFAYNAQPATAAGFANQRFATVVPAAVIGGGRPVAAAAIQVHPDTFAKSAVNARAVEAIRPTPAVNRPAPAGPVAPPPAAARGGVAAARPALPPAHGQGPARVQGPQPNRGGPPAAAAPHPTGPQPNGPQPGMAARPEVRPGQPPAPPPHPEAAPNAVRPSAPNEAGRAEPGRPEPRPAPIAHPAAPPEAEHARPPVATPAPHPDAARPAEPQREPRPATAPRPETHEAAPRAEPPRPQAAPHPEAAPRPQPAPQQHAAPAPRPEPQHAAPPPHPAPAPHPAPPAHPEPAKEPPKKPGEPENH